MTTVTDIANRALIQVGIQKRISSVNQDSTEAQLIAAVYENVRDDLTRMAPWNCALRTANLIYITSVPGTPENTSAATTLWQPGQPSPPWAYEYQYPNDCLRDCWIIPATQSGTAGSIPITAAVTGGAATTWRGPPIRHKVQTDKFCAVTAAAVVAGGAGYVFGDFITLASGLTTNPPIGAPAVLQVTGAPGGVISTVAVVPQLNGATSDFNTGGSYFAVQPNPVAQGSTTGIGTGATFNLTQNLIATPQRVILTNQEFATLVYCQQVTDPNVMDTLFQSAWTSLIGATICVPLTGNIGFANNLIQQANRSIEAARNVDGNEGLTVNDITPDWIRARGICYADEYSGPFSNYDWGALWPTY